MKEKINIIAWLLFLDRYRRYRGLLQESLMCAEESMTECPSILLVAVSTSDAGPLGCFEQLDSAHHLPHNFQTGQYDPNTGRVYLLVHDMSSSAAPTTSSVDPEMVLRQMRQRFRGIHCQLLLLNSLPTPNLTAPDVWKDSVAPVFFPDQTPAASSSSSSLSSPKAAAAAAAGGEAAAAAGSPIPSSSSSSSSPSGDGSGSGGGDGSVVRGCCLSADDMLALKDLVHQLAIKEVVPAMEKRVTTLNTTVSSTRKGVKNVLKSWWRKPREASDDRNSSGAGGGQVQYRFDQIENQILLLADSAFVMKDVDTALSNYRLVRDDFKSDKAFIHQGCCQVCCALAGWLAVVCCLFSFLCVDSLVEKRSSSRPHTRSDTILSHFE